MTGTFTSPHWAFAGGKTAHLYRTLCPPAFLVGVLGKHSFAGTKTLSKNLLKVGASTPWKWKQMAIILFWRIRVHSVFLYASDYTNNRRNWVRPAILLIEITGDASLASICRGTWGLRGNFVTWKRKVEAFLKKVWAENEKVDPKMTLQRQSSS